MVYLGLHFLHFYFVLVISLFKIALNLSLSIIPKHKKAAMCLMEQLCYNDSQNQYNAMLVITDIR